MSKKKKKANSWQEKKNRESQQADQFEKIGEVGKRETIPSALSIKEQEMLITMTRKISMLEEITKKFLPNFLAVKGIQDFDVMLKDHLASNFELRGAVQTSYYNMTDIVELK